MFFLKRIRTEKEIKKYNTILSPVLTNFEKTYEVKGNYLIYKFLEGGTLQSFIEEETLDEITKNNVIKSLIQNLTIIHNQNIIHRDLTPNNIIINGKSVSIIDFDTSSPNKGSHTQHIGTPMYTAPEVSETSFYDKSIDIYSLGMIIYYMEGGIEPNKTSEEDKDWFEEVKISERVSLWFRPNTSIYLKEIILRCTNINPKIRPSLQELYNIQIFPSRASLIVVASNDKDPDIVFAKHLNNDIRSSLNVYYKKDIAYNKGELDYIRLKATMNGFYTYSGDFLDRDDIDYTLSLFCGGRYEADVALTGLIAFDINTTTYYSFLYLDLIQSRKFIQDYYPKNTEEILGFPLVFSDVDEFMVDLNNDFSFMSNLISGKYVAQDFMMASYYSLRWIGICRFVNMYVEMDDGDRDEIMHRIMQYSCLNPLISYQQIGYLLTGQCPEALSFLDLLGIAFNLGVQRTYCGLGIIFIAYAIWGGLEFAKSFVDNLESKITRKPKTDPIFVNKVRVGREQKSAHEISCEFVHRCPFIWNILKNLKTTISLYKKGDTIIGFRQQNDEVGTHLHGRECVSLSQCQEHIYTGVSVTYALLEILNQENNSGIHMTDEIVVIQAYFGWIQTRTTFTPLFDI